VVEFKSQLSDRGYFEILRNDRLRSHRPIQIARALVPMKIQVSKLRPASKENARPNTLSSSFGLDEFPIHTDFSTQVIPAHYLILHTTKKRRAKTIVYDSREILAQYGAEFVSRSIFKIRNGRSCYFSSALAQIAGQNVFRINPATMTPVNAEATVIWEFIKNRQIGPVSATDWSSVKTLIIDNWVMMHSREAVYSDDDPISLRRIAIWSNQ
jgi:hypothetical protein